MQFSEKSKPWLLSETLPLRYILETQILGRENIHSFKWAPVFPTS